MHLILPRQLSCEFCQGKDSVFYCLDSFIYSFIQHMLYVKHSLTTVDIMALIAW